MTLKKLDIWTIAFLISLLSASGFVIAIEVDDSDKAQLEIGKEIYMNGLLPSRRPVKALIQNDIEVSGEQVSCGSCHRKSGMGSSEGSQVVPAVGGDILFNPLQIPTSKPPESPILRPAYTEHSLIAAITQGVGADGTPLDPNMPRYLLTKQEIEAVVTYLKTLANEPSPGVDDNIIHFSTIVVDDASELSRQAHMDVLNTYIKQKNTETRYESKRAANAPWHKQWIFGPYRKWKLHTWKLQGPSSSWNKQLETYYKSQPVFAVVGGVAEGDWRPIHDFCEDNELPCLFPTTDLPVISDSDFYSIYMSKGMYLEGIGIADHINETEIANKKIIQVYRSSDAKAVASADGLRTTLMKRGHDIKDVSVSSTQQPMLLPESTMYELSTSDVVVMWLTRQEVEELWKKMEPNGIPEKLYLSPELYGDLDAKIPDSMLDRTLFVHSYGLPDKLSRLLIRSTGWLKVRRIYAPEEKRVQANAYFALKAAGDSLSHIRGYFYRDYFIERIEHMVDNATYTSVYPRVSLAPNQRFASKGYVISRPSRDGKLTAVTDWRAPK